MFIWAIWEPEYRFAWTFCLACLDNQEVQLVCLYCIDCFKRYCIENKTVEQEVHMILCFQFRIIVAIGLVL